MKRLIMDNWDDEYGSEVDEFNQLVPLRKQVGQTDAETLYLFTRFLTGLAVMGGEELFERLRTFQAEYDDKLASGRVKDESGDENGIDTLRYLLIGAVLRGQKRAVRRFQSGVNFSFRVSSSLLNTIAGLTDNTWMRPMREPIEGKVQEWQEEAKTMVREGRAAEENGRFLVQETVPDLIDDFIDYLAQNPQLAELIRAQIGEQSVSMAGVVMDNSRRISIGADNVLEGVIRRLFRLTRRSDLPASPLRGEPQTMYIRQSVDMPSQDIYNSMYDEAKDEPIESSAGESADE
jgi:hypothetical protein